MAAELDSSSEDVLVLRDEQLAVEGRGIKGAEELTLLEARCQIQLFDHPGVVSQLAIIESIKWTVPPMQEVVLTVTIKYEIVTYSINMSLLETIVPIFLAALFFVFVVNH